MIKRQQNPNWRERLIACLSGRRFSLRVEDKLQEGMAQVMLLDDIPFIREYDLGDAGRIDFFVEGVGVEAKVKGGFSDVARQLQRYAGAPDIKELLLCTSCPSHSHLPSSISGKPLHLIKLWKAL